MVFLIVAGLAAVVGAAAATGQCPTMELPTSGEYSIVAKSSATWRASMLFVGKETPPAPGNHSAATNHSSQIELENKCPLWIRPGFDIYAGKGTKVADVLYSGADNVFLFGSSPAKYDMQIQDCHGALTYYIKQRPITWRGIKASILVCTDHTCSDVVGASTTKNDSPNFGRNEIDLYATVGNSTVKTPTVVGKRNNSYAKTWAVTGPAGPYVEGKSPRIADPRIMAAILTQHSFFANQKGSSSSLGWDSCSTLAFAGAGIIVLILVVMCSCCIQSCWVRLKSNQTDGYESIVN